MRRSVASERFSVTAAIPAYNEAARISETIAAIRAQTEPPAEIVVVDDGSTDNTAEVAQALGARVIRQPNAGVAVARNRAIKEALQPWVALCDADDHWAQDKLACMRRAHELRPEVAFLFGDCAVIEGKRVVIPSMFADAREFSEHLSGRLDSDTVYFERSALAQAIAKRNFVPTSTVVVRRESLLEHDVFFDPGLTWNDEFLIAEDLEWYLRLLRYTDALAVDRVVERYQQRAGSLSSNRARMHSGLVKLGELVAAAPDRYASGAAAAFAATRRRHVLEAAVACCRELRFRRCRDWLREAQRIQFVPRDQVFYALAAVASLPGFGVAMGAAVRAWQRVIKPALRSLRS